MQSLVADTLLPYLLRALAATGYTLLVVLGPGVGIGAAMHLVAGVTARRAQALFGARAYHLAGGGLGTVVHEAGHALFALLFGHRVTSVKWFDPQARDGALGAVHHEYDPRSPYQQVGRFFIGVGPLVLGTAVVALSARLLLGPAVLAPAGSLALTTDGVLTGAELPALGRDVARATREVVAALVTPAHLATWRFWAFGYVAFAVGSSIQLSRADLSSVVRGAGALAALLLAVNLATLWAGDAAERLALAAARTCAAYYAVMLLVLAVSILVAAAVLTAGVAARALRRGGRGR